MQPFSDHLEIFFFCLQTIPLPYPQKALLLQLLFTLNSNPSKRVHLSTQRIIQIKIEKI